MLDIFKSRQYLLTTENQIVLADIEPYLAPGINSLEIFRTTKPDIYLFAVSDALDYLSKFEREIDCLARNDEHIDDKAKNYFVAKKRLYELYSNLSRY